MTATGDYAKLNKLLLLAGLLYLLWPQIRQALGNLGVQLPDLSRLLPAGGAPLTAEQLAGIQLDRSAPAPAPAPPGGSGGSVVGAIGGTVTSIAGAAAGAGAGALAIGLTAGVAAVGVILAWGVLRQGWFRGGEEGVVVNPARDQFLANFAALDYMRDGRNPPGFYGLAWLLTNLGQGDGGGPTFAAVTAAQKKTQLEAAVSTVQSIIAANQAKTAQLWEYARRDGSAPQRSVTPAAA